MELPYHFPSMDWSTWSTVGDICAISLKITQSIVKQDVRLGERLSSENLLMGMLSKRGNNADNPPVLTGN